MIVKILCLFFGKFNSRVLFEHRSLARLERTKQFCRLMRPYHQPPHLRFLFLE